MRAKKRGNTNSFLFSQGRFLQGSVSLLMSNHVCLALLMTEQTPCLHGGGSVLQGAELPRPSPAKPSHAPQLQTPTGIPGGPGGCPPVQRFAELGPGRWAPCRPGYPVTWVRAAKIHPLCSAGQIPSATRAPGLRLPEF